MRTLILDQTWRPHRVVSWQRAVTLLYEGKVEVIEEGDEEIRSVTIVIKMPLVVRLLRAIRGRKNAVKFSRINVAARDGFSCQYCRQKYPLSKLTYDHVLPRSAGGKTEWTNIVCACYPCNERKRNRTPEQAGMALIKKPVKPSWLPVIALHLDLKDIPSAWYSYMLWNSTMEEGA